MTLEQFEQIMGSNAKRDRRYEEASVTVLPETKVTAKVDAQGKRYVIEAAIPLELLAQAGAGGS